MNDQPDPLVLVGGPLTIQALVKRYASLKGWEQVVVIAPPDNENLARWSRQVAQIVQEISKPGDKVQVFLPARLHTGWLKTLQASGRLTEIPLADLGIARQIATLYRWIAALESKPGSSSRLARRQENSQGMFLQAHPRRSAPAPQQDETRRPYELR